MPITTNDLEFLLSLSREAASTAILPRFRNLSATEIGAKSNEDDLVTIADRESEAIIEKGIRAHWPDAVVIGEEAVSEGVVSRSDIAGAERAVIIDPIDGTWNFARGLALFGVILAVVENGETIAGMLYDPIGDDAVTALKGDGAAFWTSDGTKHVLRTASAKPIDSRIGYSAHGLMPKPVQREIAVPLTDFRRVLGLRCSCHEYRMLAMGHADFCITGALEPWDHAAGALIVSEAGGHVAMADGSAYAPTRHDGIMIAASSKTAWDDVHARVGQALAAI